ncbi:MAG TPA: DUF3048 domain-containing protein [Chloroflexota bacterium]|nr:DUF3048 domain-containing protein [Chloroflexota bacterium]
MLRRRAIVVGLAGLVTACAGPAPAPTAPPAVAPATPTPVPSTAAATQPPKPTNVPPTLVPTVAPTATSEPHVALDVRLWNGSAEVHLDGRTIQPGQQMVEPGVHHLAALLDGEVVSAVDSPAEGGAVDLTVPPPHAALAVMVENQADARPQSGLPSADVVYEALAEGGITRFIAIFLTGDAPIVGPVRSLRHYFAFLAGDYGADVVHIGASPEGFAWRDAMNMGHLDESAGDPGVWRVRTRPPPHNAFTDTAADRGFLSDRGRQRNRLWGPLRISSAAPRGEEPAEQITLGFRPWAYRVHYDWDGASERYLRTMDGVPHRDGQTGEQIAPATIVVQFADVEAIPGDPKLRLDVDLVGAKGDLLVFSGGRQRSGTWSKAGARSATRWLDDEGQAMVIPHGQVWVEVVPLGSPVVSN